MTPSSKIDHKSSSQRYRHPGNIQDISFLARAFTLLNITALTVALTDCQVIVPPYGSVSEALASSTREVSLIADSAMPFSTTGTDCKASTSADLVFNVFALYESG